MTCAHPVLGWTGHALLMPPAATRVSATVLPRSQADAALPRERNRKHNNARIRMSRRFEVKDDLGDSITVIETSSTDDAAAPIHSRAGIRGRSTFVRADTNAILTPNSDFTEFTDPVRRVVYRRVV